MKLTDAVYLVTGGGSGLGAAAARRLHAAGAHVLICNRTEATGAFIVAELGERAAFVSTDVTIESDAARAVDVAVEKFGALHGLINCAGVSVGELVLGESGPHRLESFTRCLGVNLIGTFNMIRFAAEAMSKNEATTTGERGVIVNTASIVAFEGQIGTAAYSAANAAVVGMTLPIARELARYGIRVVTIAPGPFITPRLHSLPRSVQDAISKAIPFPQRLGRPEEYAALVQHIAENEMLNGETIRLDGAMRLEATLRMID